MVSVIAEGCGKAVESEAMTAAEGRCSCSAKSWSGGNDQKASGSTEIKIMGGGLVALAKMFCCDENETTVLRLGIIPDLFFLSGDEWGYEYTAVGRGVEPVLSVDLALLSAFGAVYHHLILEGVIQKLHISVSLAMLAVNNQII